MFKKQALRWNCTSLFPSVFSLILVNNRSEIKQKTWNIALCKQKKRLIKFETPFFHQKVDSWSIFGVPLGPRGPPGMSWEAPRNIQISVYFQLRLKKRPGPTPGRPQGGSGCPPGTSPASFWIDFGLIFQVDSHTRRIPSEVARNCKKMWQGHRSLAELSQRLPGCCLWLQCCVPCRAGPLLI